MSTTTIRVDRSTHEHLRDLAEDLGYSLAATVAKAIDCYRRHIFFERLNAQYAELQADGKAWQEELDERAEFEATLMDDLEDDPWPIEQPTAAISG